MHTNSTAATESQREMLTEVTAAVCSGSQAELSALSSGLPKRISPRPLARSSAMPMSPTSVRSVSGHPHAAMFSTHCAGGKNSSAVRSNPGARVAAIALFPKRRSRCSSPEAAASSQPPRNFSTVHVSSNISCATRLSSASHSAARRASPPWESSSRLRASSVTRRLARRASLSDCRLPPPSEVVLALHASRLVSGAGPGSTPPLLRAKEKIDRSRPARPVAPSAAARRRPFPPPGTLLVSSRNIFASSTTTGSLNRMKNIVPPAGSRVFPELPSSPSTDSRGRRKGRTSSRPSMCVAGRRARVRAEPNSDRRGGHGDQVDHSPSEDDCVRNISVAWQTSACDHCTSLGSVLSSTGVDATTLVAFRFRSVCVIFGRSAERRRIRDRTPNPHPPEARRSSSDRSRAYTSAPDTRRPEIAPLAIPPGASRSARRVPSVNA